MLSTFNQMSGLIIRVLLKRVRFVLILLIVSLFLLIEGAFERLQAFTVISNAGQASAWTNGQVTYRFNTAPSGYFNGGADHSGTASDDFAPIRAAFQTWQIPGVNLTFNELSANSTAPNSDDGINSVKWVSSNWRSLAFRPPSNALAVTLVAFDSHTGKIKDADIYFNSEIFDWAIVDAPSESGYIDVQNIATHEIGHLLGMDHSSESLLESDDELADATMYYAATSGETYRRDLNSDDERGITNLYGSSSDAVPTVTSYELLDSDGTTATLKISGSNFSNYTTFVITRYDDNFVDAVSRYKTISSSTNAEVTFDFRYGTLPAGSATLLAYNRANAVSSLAVRVEGSNFYGDSGGGGGGCQLKVGSIVSENLASSSMLFIFFVAFSLICFACRSRAQADS
jgi:hypothetical protein